MPSVAMRRSTRVFGAHVLRPGRRLWPESDEAGKNVRTDHIKDQWAQLVEDSGDECKETVQENGNGAFEDVRMEENGNSAFEFELVVENVDMMYGIVYKRKRKRAKLGEMGPMEDRWFGKKFYRGRWTKKIKVASCETRWDSSGFHYLAIAVNGSHSEYGYWMTCFLATVLSYITRGRIGIRELLKFLVSKPIFDAYSSCGALFLQDSTSTKNPVICIISGSKSLTPLFSFNFSTIPSFFMHMQTCMYLRTPCLFSCFPLSHSSNIIFREDDKVRDASFDNTEKLQHSNIIFTEDDKIRDTSFDNTETPQHYFQTPEHQDFVPTEKPQTPSRRKVFSASSLGVTKSSLRSFKSRNSHHIQKRRRSLRRKRGRQLSGFRSQKTDGTSASDFFRIRQESFQPSSITKNTKQVKFTFTKDIFTTGCSVNLLITEPNRCYREEGATITLQTSPSKQWVLSVAKEGVKKYGFSAEKVMRPSCTNRFSHAMIWAVNSGCKLEFLDRQDWLIFKELYKECYERNMLSPAASVIPVPFVQEVEEVSTPFIMDPKAYVRPDSYIRVKDDELTRAMAKKSPIYDMDSDDEVWLQKLNAQFSEGVEVGTCIMPESFEMIIDALEKGVYCNPNVNFEERAVCDSCIHLERREVVEAVHSYWVKKRKQKRAALLTIFQLYQPRRIQVIPKPVLRKKRSFKRHPVQARRGKGTGTGKGKGKGKHGPVFRAIAAERAALEQQNNAQKLQEAKADVCRFEELAILKRQRAQMLMTNADLATYKALMALRIAEGSEILESEENLQSLVPVIFV